MWLQFLIVQNAIWWKVKTVYIVFNCAQRHAGVWWSGRRAPHILKHGSVISKTRYLCEHCLTERKRYNSSIFSVVFAMFSLFPGFWRLNLLFNLTYSSTKKIVSCKCLPTLWLYLFKEARGHNCTPYNTNRYFIFSHGNSRVKLSLKF
jgi:hypothetical protein